MKEVKDFVINRIEDVPILREINPLGKYSDLVRSHFSDEEEYLTVCWEWEKKEKSLKEYKLRVQQEQEVEKLAQRFTDDKYGRGAHGNLVDKLKDAFLEGYKAASLKAKGNQRVFDEGAFSLSDVLKKLIDATNILLHKKDYDGGDYEEMGICVKRAGEIIELLNKPIEQTGFTLEEMRKCYEHAFDEGQEEANGDGGEDWEDYIQSLHPQYKVGDVLKCEVDEQTMTANPIPL